MNPTPSARSVKEATQAVEKACANFNADINKRIIEAAKKGVAFEANLDPYVIETIALALDQRERETWRDAAAVLPEKQAVEPFSQIPVTDKQKRNQGWNAARSALLSEAERRGMGTKSDDEG